MVGVKTSDELPAGPLTGAELSRITQNGKSFRTTLGDIAAINRVAAYVDDFGAVGDGVTDDSAAFVAALASNLAIQCNGGKYYNIGDITLTSNQSINFNNARVKAKAGCSFMVKLTGFAATVENFYVTSGTGASVALFVIDNTRFATVQNGRILNAANIFKLQATVPATGCVKTSLINIQAQNYTGIGLDAGPNVLQIAATDVFFNPTAGSGGDGVRVVSTGSVIAYGGHTYVNVRCEGCVTGWLFTDATLTNIIGGWADTCSGIGMRITGSSDHFDISDFFIGTCLGGGISVEGTSSVNLSGVETFNNFDTISVLNTARLTFDGYQWKGSRPAPIVASGARFNYAGPMLCGTTVGTVAASTTVYVGLNGAQATENDTAWRLPYNAQIIGIYVTSTVTPVTTHSFTVRVNGVDTALTATINPAGFEAVAYGSVFAPRGQTVTMKVATSTTNPSRFAVNILYSVQ